MCNFARSSALEIGSLLIAVFVLSGKRQIRVSAASDAIPLLS